MGGGGETKTVENNKTDPWAGQQPYLSDAFGEAQGIYNSQKGVNNAYTGDFVAAPRPEMVSAFQNALGNTQGQGQAAVNQSQATGSQLAGMGTAGTAGAMGGLFNFAGQDPTQANIAAAGQYANNPQMDGMVQAATRDATRNFNEQTMPGIDRGAAATGNLNSTRTGVAQGIAQRGLQDTIADTSAQLRGSAYSDGLQMAQQDRGNVLQALMGAGGMAGNAAQTGLGGLGQSTDMASKNLDQSVLSSTMLNGYDQSAIDNNIAKNQYQQNLPWQNLQNYYGIIGDKSWGSQSTGASTVKQNPSTLSTLGSGLAVMGSLFRSDIRVKDVLYPAGKTRDGIPMYVWSYKDDPSMRAYVGPMAQDVQKRYPEAVIELDGVLHIDLSKYDWR